MSALKDMWMQAYEDIYEEAILGGATEDEATLMAEAGASTKQVSRLTDMIDAERMRRKDGGK